MEGDLGVGPPAGVEFGDEVFAVAGGERFGGEFAAAASPPPPLR
ncbi:hypothetical protein [Saccharopolyspora tripterygii]